MIFISSGHQERAWQHTGLAASSSQGKRHKQPETHSYLEKLPRPMKQQLTQYSPCLLLVSTNVHCFDVINKFGEDAMGWKQWLVLFSNSCD